MKKITLFLIICALFSVIYLSVQGTYSIYVKTVNKSITLTTTKLEATFLPGSEFNAKVKQLAGNSNATYETLDTNITSIVRSNILTITPTTDNIVSTSDSPFPIYAWFSNGTIYYYTEVEHPYMNSDPSYMFASFSNLISIDISSIDTSTALNLTRMFYMSGNLITLDLRNFNTNNILSMYGLVQYCSKLQQIDLSSFNTSNLIGMGAMFYGASAIESLDLSSFDMSLVTNTDNMLYGLTSLKEFKTPKIYPNDTSVVLTLPKTMYDENLVGYSSLGKSTTPTSPVQTLLKEGYIVTFDAEGGSVSPSTKFITEDSTTYGILPTPTKIGYTFLRWEVPSDYVQLDYIESTGTQYINTNYIPKTSTKIKLELSFNGEFRSYADYGGNNGFLGVNEENGLSSFSINYGAGTYQNNLIYPWFNKR